MFTPATPDDRLMNTKLSQEHGQLGGLPKGIRHIADRHPPTPLLAIHRAKQEITGDRFGTDDQKICLGIPGADQNTPSSNKALHSGALLRCNLIIIFQHDCLTIQHKGPQFLILLESIQEVMHEIIKDSLRVIFGKIPFSVPVCMLNQMHHFHIMTLTYFPPMH
ncbi:hypothetical protein D3C77_318880 [compost metagenome]